MQRSCPSPWRKILSSPCSSKAVDVASTFNPADLSEAPLPSRPEELHKCAYDNLISVCRALGVRVDGFRSDFWDTWSESEESDVESNTTIDKSSQTTRAVTSRPSLQIPAATKPDPKAPAATCNGVLSLGIGSDAAKAVSTAYSVTVLEPPSKRVTIQIEDETPSAEDLKHASILKNWGQSSAHRAPPQTSVCHVTHSACFATLLKEIVPPTCAPAFRAAILSALVEDLPSSIAPVVQSLVILPFMKELKTPAPREMLNAILSFTTRHSRHVVNLYSHFSGKFHTVSNGVVEILALIVPTIPQPIALDAFKLIASAIWSDVTIPLISAMTNQCQSLATFLDLLIPALDRNAPDLEKSVRFGKLLFTLVNDLPQIRQTYKQPMEAICLRSKVFLAKRALTLLKSDANPQ